MIKKSKERERNEDGFSLIELVVAIGILMIISGGGVISYSSLMKNVKQQAVEDTVSLVNSMSVANITDENEFTTLEQVVELYNKDIDSTNIRVSSFLDETECLIVEAVYIKDETISFSQQTCNVVPVVVEPEPYVPPIPPVEPEYNGIEGAPNDPNADGNYEAHMVVSLMNFAESSLDIVEYDSVVFSVRDVNTGVLLANGGGNDVNIAPNNEYKINSRFWQDYTLSTVEEVEIIEEVIDEEGNVVIEGSEKIVEKTFATFSDLTLTVNIDGVEYETVIEGNKYQVFYLDDGTMYLIGGMSNTYMDNYYNVETGEWLDWRDREESNE